MGKGRRTFSYQKIKKRYWAILTLQRDIHLNGIHKTGKESSFGKADRLVNPVTICIIPIYSYPQPVPRQ
jgi:hypothetical protein